MKAWLARELGSLGNLSLEEVPVPEPGKGQVLIEVKVCGVNFPDVLIVKGQYQVKFDLPITPGVDMTGIVRKVGEGVTRAREGDRVAVTSAIGGFAEMAIVPEFNLIPLPPNVDFDDAAAMLMTYFTSYHALKDRAKLQAGETMLVLGAAGGVGSAAIELGKLLGAKVIAAASTAEKLAVCTKFGADEVINYSTEDLKTRIKDLTGGKGVDVVYDPVGGKYSEIALRSTAYNGRFLVVGFANGDIASIPLNLALLKNCSIVGVFWGNFALREPKANLANATELFDLLSQGKIKPLISMRYSLHEANRALYDLAERKAIGKILVVNQ